MFRSAVRVRRHRPDAVARRHGIAHEGLAATVRADHDTEGDVMANKGVCSTRLNVDGVYLDYRKHEFYCLGTDTAGNDVPVRVRHYRDLLKAHPDSVRDGQVTIVVADKSAALGRFEILDVLRDAVQYGYLRSEPIPSAPSLRTGHTRDVLRNQRRRLPDGRSLTGEGGLGFTRPPAQELRMLAMADRGADAFYETAEARARRQRELVARVLAEGAGQIDEVITELQRSRLRVPALTVAVDALVLGAPGSAARLAGVMTRPDDPITALKHFRDTYPNRKVPSALKRALAEASTRLWDESACLRFDVNRNRGVMDRSTRSAPVRFADVIRLTRPRPSSPEQSRLFAAVLSGYRDTDGLPLLDARRRLRGMDHAAARAEISAARQRADADRAAFGFTAEPLARFTLSELVSLVAAPRLDVREAADALDAARSELKALSHVTHRETFVQERRLRSRVRDARDRHRAFLATARGLSAGYSYLTPLSGPPELTVEEEKTAVAVLASLRTRRTDVRAAVAGLPPYLVSEILRRRNEELAAAVTARLDDLVSFRTRPDNKAARHEIIDARRDVRNALIELQRRKRSPGDVDADIIRLTVPSMGPVEALSSLAMIERAGLHDELAGQIASRIHGKVRLPDVLRAARGAALATTRSTATHAHTEPSSWFACGATVWEPMLENALQAPLAEKLPAIPGRVLILVDGSGSMHAEVSGRRNDQRSEGYASLSCAEVAAFAASAIASRCQSAPDVYAYDTKAVRVEPTGGVLAGVRSIAAALPGGGTDTFGVLSSTFREHDLVVILTDEQTSTVPRPRRRVISSSTYPADPVAPVVPDSTRVVTVNLAGFSAAHAEPSGNHVEISGWSEALFDSILPSAAQ